jgi:hypothetical protein
MRIYPTSEPTDMRAIPSRTAAAGPRLGQDTLALGATETLSHSLEQTPEVRADKVAQAKTLIGDVKWPPAEIIGKIATLLANHIRTQDPPN